jgi:hypothetical protein
MQPNQPTDLCAHPPQVDSKERAIEIENNNPYGNAACIYTSVGAHADWFARRFSVGMVGVNIGVPVPREPFSFGGSNISKYGDLDITGTTGAPPTLPALQALLFARFASSSTSRLQRMVDWSSSPNERR